MQRRLSRKNIIFFLGVVSVYVIVLNIDCIYAVPLKEEAKSYREKGYEAQERGDIDDAISWYQKAVTLDANYAAPHNDLGILYETKSWLDRAEQEYQKALIIDPNYTKAHTNLALLYERKGELEKAAFHWMKRYRYGSPDERWTLEARERLERLGLLDEKELRRRIPFKEEPPREAKAEKKETKDAEVWERIKLEGKKPKEEKVAKTLDKGLQKELQESLRIEEERIEKEKSRKKLAKKKPDKIRQPAPKYEKKEIDKKLQESLNLAWERLRQEKAEEKFSKDEEFDKKIQSSLDLEESNLKEALDLAEESLNIKIAKKKDFADELKMSLNLEEERQKRKDTEEKKKSLDEEVKELRVLVDMKLEKQKSITEDLDREKSKSRVTDPKARTSYSNAYSFYKKGEYSMALDTIRLAKKEYPKETSLLELEETVKNKMKEERLNDHYIEGMLLYEQKDFVGAKKEFEAILNMLPE